MAEMLLQAWLGFLSGFEAFTIYKLQTGTKLMQAFPLFSNDFGIEFKNLFILLAGLLSIIRVNCMWSMPSPTAWRACALAHVLEAVYYWNTAFYMEQTLPLTLSAWRKERHLEATVVFGTIAFNAVLFTARWLYLRAQEKAFIAEQVAKEQAKREKAAKKQ